MDGHRSDMLRAYRRVIHESFLKRKCSWIFFFFTFSLLFFLLTFLFIFVYVLLCGWWLWVCICWLYGSNVWEWTERATLLCFFFVHRDLHFLVHSTTTSTWYSTCTATIYRSISLFLSFVGDVVVITMIHLSGCTPYLCSYDLYRFL